DEAARGSHSAAGRHLGDRGAGIVGFLIDINDVKKGMRRMEKWKKAKNARHVSKSKSKKHVYFFGNGKAEGDRTMKDLLGGKGSGLAEMTNAGLPVPPGFTISTAVCTLYYGHKGKIPANVEREMLANLAKLEKSTKAE